MANTQGLNPLCWRDDDLLLLMHIIKVTKPPDLAPSLARPSSPIIPEAPVQQLQPTSSEDERRISETLQTKAKGSSSAVAKSEAAEWNTTAWSALVAMHELLQWSANALQARQHKIEAELAETEAKLAES